MTQDITISFGDSEYRLGPDGQLQQFLSAHWRPVKSLSDAARQALVERLPAAAQQAVALLARQAANADTDPPSVERGAAVVPLPGLARRVADHVDLAMDACRVLGRAECDEQESLEYVRAEFPAEQWRAAVACEQTEHGYWEWALLEAEVRAQLRVEDARQHDGGAAGTRPRLHGG